MSTSISPYKVQVVPAEHRPPLAMLWNHLKGIPRGEAPGQYFTTNLENQFLVLEVRSDLENVAISKVNDEILLDLLMRRISVLCVKEGQFEEACRLIARCFGTPQQLISPEGFSYGDSSLTLVKNKTKFSQEGCYIGQQSAELHLPKLQERGRTMLVWYPKDVPPQLERPLRGSAEFEVSLEGKWKSFEAFKKELIPQCSGLWFPEQFFSLIPLGGRWKFEPITSSGGSRVTLTGNVHSQREFHQLLRLGEAMLKLPEAHESTFMSNLPIRPIWWKRFSQNPAEFLARVGATGIESQGNVHKTKYMRFLCKPEIYLHGNYSHEQARSWIQSIALFLVLKGDTAALEHLSRGKIRLPMEIDRAEEEGPSTSYFYCVAERGEGKGVAELLRFIPEGLVNELNERRVSTCQ